MSERESLHKVKGKDRFDGKKSDILKIQGRQRDKKSDYFLKKDSERTLDMEGGRL